MRLLTLKRLPLIVLALAGILSAGSGEWCGGYYDEESWGGIVEQSKGAVRPHWSADGQTIIFKGLPQGATQSLMAWSEGNIYRVGLDGSSLKKIAEEAYWLDVSRTGDRILFTTAPYEEYEYRLESARQDGSDRQKLAERYHIATLSPDGIHLAFHDNWSQDAGVSIMDVDGSDVRRVAVLDTINDHYSEQAVVSRFETARPVWSPNGKSLAFVIRESADSDPDESQTNVLYTLGIDDSELREVFRTPPWADQGEFVYEPAWSPDGQRLAFVHASGREKAVLYTIRADGSDLRSIARGLDEQQVLINDNVLSWSPDGSEILFGVWGNQLFIADVESGRYQRLAAGLGASWSPDGSRIAVIGGDFFPKGEIGAYGEGPCGAGEGGVALGHPHLYTMKRDGSDLRVLVGRDAGGHLQEANPRSFWPWADWEPC